jgi:hypothetical protein
MDFDRSGIKYLRNINHMKFLLGLRLKTLVREGLLFVAGPEAS